MRLIHEQVTTILFKICTWESLVGDTIKMAIHMTRSTVRSMCGPVKHHTLARRWSNAGPPSTTLAQH